MGIVTEAPSAPDTFGLPEFFITDIFTEITGSNVRIICGSRRNGVVHWLYSSVMPADLLLGCVQQCSDAAHEAINLLHIMDRRQAH